MERKMVLPGDEIAVAEEFEPGEGTYEAKGLVFAATPGVLELDPANRVARVRAFNPPAELRVGDIVYGAVDDIRGMMATATIQAIHGRTRQISGESEGTIHISNVSEEYTEDIHDMYRLGDIIRAKVIQVKPSLQLTTAEPTLGVVKALCSVCRGPLEIRGRDLYCPRDERSERRKMAEDATDGAGNAVDGTAIAIDVVSPRGKFRGRSVPRISTKNPRQRDMNLPCDSSA